MQFQIVKMRSLKSESHFLIIESLQIELGFFLSISNQRCH